MMSKKIEQAFMLIGLLTIIVIAIYLFKVGLTAVWPLLVLMVIVPFSAWLVFSGKLAISNKEVRKTVLGGFAVICFFLTIGRMAKGDAFDAFVCEYLVDGVIVSNTVTIEPDEGAPYQEGRRIFIPSSEKGERMANILNWITMGIAAGGLVVTFLMFTSVSQISRRLKK